MKRCTIEPFSKKGKSMQRLLRLIILPLVLLAALQTLAWADSPVARDFPPGITVPQAAQASPDFDADRATAAWLDLMSPEQRALSDSYFEGGYWLPLWNLLYGFGIAAVLLLTGIMQRVRSAAERWTRRLWLSTAISALFFIVTSTLLGVPLSIYTDFIREHQYGLSNLTFGGFIEESLKALLVNAILGTLGFVVIYVFIRRAGNRWWIWATGFSFVFTAFIGMISPVFISPLFNTYKPLADGPVREAILSLARANQIPTTDVEWFDASKQTSRVSANVSGLFGTTHISLNDNLLERTSLPEIKAVLGHEMGHYVLNHSFRLTLYFTLIFGVVFAIVHLAFDWCLARWGARLQLSGRVDVAALPLAVCLFSAVLFLLAPLTNTVIRQAEAEADAFGLNAAREPQGFAMAAMRLSTYRKIHPGPLEEIIFFDHPSGYARVHGSMTWLKENLNNPDQQATLPK
jgi:STE24 endopeptidase